MHLKSAVYSNLSDQLLEHDVVLCVWANPLAGRHGGGRSQFACQAIFGVVTRLCNPGFHAQRVHVCRGLKSTHLLTNSICLYTFFDFCRLM